METKDVVITREDKEGNKSDLDCTEFSYDLGGPGITTVVVHAFSKQVLPKIDPQQKTLEGQTPPGPVELECAGVVQYENIPGDFPDSSGRVKLSPVGRDIKVYVVKHTPGGDGDKIIITGHNKALCGSISVGSIYSPGRIEKMLEALQCIEIGLERQRLKAAQKARKQIQRQQDFMTHRKQFGYIDVKQLQDEPTAMCEIRDFGNIQDLNELPARYGLETPYFWYSGPLEIQTPDGMVRIARNQQMMQMSLQKLLVTLRQAGSRLTAIRTGMPAGPPGGEAANYMERLDAETVRYYI